MDKLKKYSIIIGVVGLLLILTGVTYSFFNYTRTGLANNFSVGNIYFSTSQNGNINLTNVFPIKSEDLTNDVGNHDSVTVTITGNTTYSEGIEYLVSLDQVNNTINGKRIPITFNTEVTGLGNTSQDYYNDRGGDSSIYELYEEGRVREGEYLLTGYITSGVSGINGSITLTAYIDADKIAISDTYNGAETDNMGTTREWVNNRVVFTTSEWENFQGNNAISFKIKVEANEGVWVIDPSTLTDASCFTYGNRMGEYEFNTNITPEAVSNCVSFFEDTKEWGVDEYNGETMESFCEGTGTMYGSTFQELIDNGSIDSSDLDILNDYDVVNAVGYIAYISDYDTSCGRNVVIPQYADVILYNYSTKSLNETELNTCIDYLSNVGYTVDTSNGETMESFCNGTGTMWGGNFQDRLDTNYFIQSELDYLEENGILNKTIETIINHKVVGISYNAFHNKNLQTVVFPNDIYYIGNAAFKGNMIDEVVIPNSFSDNVCNLFIFDSTVDVTQNGTTTKCDCFATKVENDSITITGYDNSCPKDVVIPKKYNGKVVKAIGTGAFSNKGITSVYIPNTIESIGYQAFVLDQLTSVDIPNSVTYIGSSAFASNQLTNVNIPNSITSIESSVFSNNQLTTIEIPSTVTRIGDHAFSYNQLTSINIPNIVTTIYNGAFRDNQITNIEIPNSVTYIGSYAFYNNPVERLIIPSVSTSFQNDSFTLNSIEYISTNARDSSNLVIPNGYNLDTLILGDGVETMIKCNNYGQNKCTVDNFSINSNYLLSQDYTNPYSTYTNSFTYRFDFKNVTIGNNVQRIGNYAFYLSKIDDLTMTDSVTSIGNYAFYSSQMNSAVMSNNITTIGNYAFGSNNLTSIELSNNITSLGQASFFRNKLNSIDIPDNITEIPTSAFNQNNISTVVIPSGVTSIGNLAFYSNPLSSVEIPSSVISIGNDAFNRSLTSTPDYYFTLRYDTSCANMKFSMSNYPWVGTDYSRDKTTIYGSNNTVCDSWS